MRKICCLILFVIFPVIRGTTTSAPSTGAPCPSCDISYHCDWSRTCAPGDTCLARGFTGNLYHFRTHCAPKEDCLLMQSIVKTEEVYCCGDRECLRNHLGLWS
eukprot:XP_011416717.1 PREDICTED: uncharacterized protein LOC105320449 [Crassostrea gigas]